MLMRGNIQDYHNRVVFNLRMRCGEFVIARYFFFSVAEVVVETKTSQFTSVERLEHLPVPLNQSVLHSQSGLWSRSRGVGRIFNLRSRSRRKL